MCPPHMKSRVYIGDFDSANYYTPNCDGDQIEGRIEILRSGTPFYRSPEVNVVINDVTTHVWKESKLTRPMANIIMEKQLAA